MFPHREQLQIYTITTLLFPDFYDIQEKFQYHLNEVSQQRMDYGNWYVDLASSVANENHLVSLTWKYQCLTLSTASSNILQWWVLWLFGFQLVPHQLRPYQPLLLTDTCARKINCIPQKLLRGWTYLKRSLELHDRLLATICFETPLISAIPYCLYIILFSRRYGLGRGLRL